MLIATNGRVIFPKMTSRTNKGLTKGQKTLDYFFSSRAASEDSNTTRASANLGLNAVNVATKAIKRNRQEDSPEKQAEASWANTRKRNNKFIGLQRDNPINLNDTLQIPSNIGSTAIPKSIFISSTSSSEIDSHATAAPERPAPRIHDGPKSPIKVVHKLPRLNIVDDPAPKPLQPRYIEVPKHKARVMQKLEAAVTKQFVSKSPPPKFVATSVKMMYGKVNKDNTYANKSKNSIRNEDRCKQTCDTNGNIDNVHLNGNDSDPLTADRKSPDKHRTSSELKDEQDENTDLQPIVEHKSPIASQSVVVSPGKVVQAADDLVSKSPLRLQNGTTTVLFSSERITNHGIMDVKTDDAEDSYDSDDLFDNVTSPVKNAVKMTIKENVPDVQHVKPRRGVLTLTVERFVENFESKPSANLLVGRILTLDTEKGQKDQDTIFDANGLMNKENAAGIYTDDIVYVILGGSWASERFEPGIEVSVFAWFRGSVCRIDATSGGLVVCQPDVLLSVTTVTSGLFCPRKALLQQKFRKLDGLNANMLVGTVAHQVFQRAVSEKLQRSEIVAVTEEILSRSSILHDIYLLGTAPHEIKAHVLQMVPHILSFIRGNCPGGRKDFRVREVVDIEENLWCPRLGLKGKVDMTVELEMAANGNIARQAPLELKTGKPSFSREHSAQVLLYTLMMNEKMGAEHRSLLPDNPKAVGAAPRDSQTAGSCGVGVLTYIQRGADSVLVKADKGSLQELIQHRNRLAKAWWALQNPELDIDTIRMRPNAVGPFKEEERFCDNCSANVACSLFAHMNKDLPEGSVRAKVATKVLGNLNEQELSYAWHWLMLLDIECAEHARQNPQAFWKYSVERRVNNGTCVASLRLANVSAKKFQDNSQVEIDINSTSNFVCLEGPPGSAINLAPGSYIALSEQDVTFRRVANRLGSVHAVDGNAIYLDLDIDPSGSKTLLDPNKKYVVDVVNSSSSFGTAYANLIRLLQPEQSRLRKMVVGISKPSFELVYPRADIERCMDILTELNESQVRAVIRLLMAQDYLLLQGMPGTGKTTIIVAAIRVLVTLGQRVLVTSNTHNALDNILEKLVHCNVDFVRMGKTSHPIVRQKTNEAQLAKATCTAQVKEFYGRQRVFGSTCLGIAHSVFEKERFDMCIVDEASQVLQPVCLGPLMLAKKFLLVGDPKQLPPVIQSKEARRLGLEECLFKGLQREDGSNLVVLNHQYRMNIEIMRLCNSLVYQGELRCGNDKIAEQTLCFADNVDTDGTVDRSAPMSPWEQRCVSADLSDSVVFVDATGVSEQESSGGSGLSNAGESRIIQRIVQLLTNKGVAASSISAITPFKRQVLQLKADLPLKVEVSTVDRYQGKENEVILFSCVRTQLTANMDQEIMNDVRRLNVAVSRARRKLILVGARQTVASYPSWEKLFASLRPENFVRVQPDNS
ncbi:DNA replication ATP-dependent helicase/nuclease DNA2-like isoform X2 [Varroa destructor]|uniref:DNA replication ATP-dependent helicase/nuclease n=1 Tax=Varroa destructor TaxID=109461 RepID=A0A7M7MDN9_VARDE|nr:DNA replication ATP-dependent helicase/nuclease DNA2-like isoform X2 [Varroa destructor]